jgi:lysophosphatidylcholine acyltransferase/lyso-PAF acetyltransferase
MLFAALFTAWLIYAVFIVRLVRNQLTKGLKYIINENKEFAEKYDPFRRKDISKWSHFEIYFCALFLLPLRIILFLVSTASCCLLIRIFLIGCKNYDQISFIRKLLIKSSSQILARSCLYSFGFYYINHVKVDISSLDPTYPRTAILQNEGRPAPIIASNHISWIDIFLHMTTMESPGYLAKHDVANYPLIGTIAKGLQTLFVQRESKEHRDDVVIRLKERINKFEKNPLTTSQVLIFPEGTTTNGEYIISFKKGAFSNLTPLKLYAIKYNKKNYSPAFDSLELGRSFLFTLTQFYNSVTLYDLGVYYPDHLKLKSEDDWQIYANKVKDIFLKVLNAKSSEMGFGDKMVYYKTLMPGNKKKEATSEPKLKS